MAVPKKKTSPSRKGMRQQRQAEAQTGTIAANPKTGTLGLRHHVVKEQDGSLWYKGVQVKAAKAVVEAAE
ncbi:MAG: 50S ribosomal protein L32 [Pseudomonadaceae bacterium]|nr:50S ribosomal protein L32 [Pseudomonadaceae bacterium]